MKNKSFYPILIMMFLSCKTGYQFAEDYYRKHRDDLHKIVELYSETSRNQHYVLRINYFGGNAEVLLMPLYGIPEVNPVIVYGSKAWEAEFSRFIREKAKTDVSKVDAMITLMKKNRCEEISKGFYKYENSINNYTSYSVAVVIKEDINKLYGLNFYGFDQVYQKEDFEGLKKIDTSVYYYETTRSVFE